MQSFTLWVLCEPPGTDILLIAQRADGTWEMPVLGNDGDEIRAFFARRGPPSQIFANAWGAVRVVREAEAKLYQVPATVLKPRDLVGPVVAIALRALRP